MAPLARRGSGMSTPPRHDEVSLSGRVRHDPSDAGGCLFAKPRATRRCWFGRMAGLAENDVSIKNPPTEVSGSSFGSFAASTPERSIRFIERSGQLRAGARFGQRTPVPGSRTGPLRYRRECAIRRNDDAKLPQPGTASTVSRVCIRKTGRSGAMRCGSVMESVLWPLRQVPCQSRSLRPL